MAMETHAPESLGPEVLTLEHIDALARSLSSGDPIDPKALSAACVDIVNALGVLLHMSQHVFQVVNPDCDGPDDCPLRSDRGAA